jgi:hypothetical protein
MAPFDLDACIQQLMKKQLLHEAVLKEICEKTKEVLMREGNVVHIEAPVTVVGDIHGCVYLQLYIPKRALTSPSQFYDLIEIFRIGGYAPSTNYLFLGIALLRLIDLLNNFFYSLQATMSTEACSASRPSLSSLASNYVTLVAYTSYEAIMNLGL